MPTLWGYLRYLITPGIVEPRSPELAAVQDVATEEIVSESFVAETSTISTIQPSEAYDDDPQDYLNICHLSDFWYSRLTSEHRKWLSDFKYFKRERHLNAPGWLPANIHYNHHQNTAIANAWSEHRSEGPIWTPWKLVYWTDGSFVASYPRSATGGIIHENSHGQLIARAVSFDPNLVCGPFDCELLSATHGMQMGLDVARDRILNGDYDFIREIVIYLDCQRLLEWFYENRFSPLLGGYLKEMFYWADKVEDAGIKLSLIWVPKREV
ncbi:hypothetical protein FKW77_010867 [Venturia effusa]|uniref:Uncharacterized protein n=1 Tax=Venturia effusa TaxID=50376 RepID=A0A517KYP7_9PEZI|nr:hypothetical protein FKW77_010867 [Venturia effusa]